MTVTARDGWRVVYFTRSPIGNAYQRMDSMLTAMGHRLVGVVTSTGPKLRRTTGYIDVVAQTRPGVDVLVSNHPGRWAAMLAPLRPDLIIVGGFSWKLPQDLLDLPRLGAINFHNAPLPRYRGRGDYILPWAFRNDDGEIGFTIHRLATEFDTGPILAQGAIPVGDDDDHELLWSRLGDLAFDLFPKAIERVANGDPGDPQNEDEVSYSVPFEEEWRVIDWSHPARMIHNQVRSWNAVRAVNPYPNTALALIDGTERQVLKTRLVKTNGTSSASPGTILDRDGETILIQCGDGPLQILSYV